MKIYTKTGDLGTTSLLGGTRVSKADLRIETYGTVDELNACIGLVADQAVNADRQEFLRAIQDRLFTIGSVLACEPTQDFAKVPVLHNQDIEALEQAIDQMNETLPTMRNFILPGGHQSVSFAHLARTVCRRAERHVIRLAESVEVTQLIIVYLNRLSDYLFVLSRKMSAELGAEEVAWKPKREVK